jgi:carbon monoxide dehydrogenase subunit G
MGTLEEQELGFAEDAPVTPEATVVINASPAEIWAVLADNETWPEWFAGLRKVVPTSGGEFGLGSTRRVELGLMKVDERFIAWDVGRLWAFTGTEMKPKLFTKLVERVVLEPLDEGRTRVTYRMAFELVPPMRLMAPALRSGMARAIAKGMRGLAERVEGS